MNLMGGTGFRDPDDRFSPYPGGKGLGKAGLVPLMRRASR